VTAAPLLAPEVAVQVELDRPCDLPVPFSDHGRNIGRKAARLRDKEILCL
jgi:hypothetical protein